jgi:uncharacterized membrane protein (UPF0127 family)
MKAAISEKPSLENLEVIDNSNGPEITDLFVRVKFILVFSGTFLFLLLILYTPMSASKAIAQTSNNNGTNIFLKAIQDASLNEDRYLKAKVTVKGFELNADLAVTQEQMSKGLSVKDKLEENESMLFVFEDPSRHSFWMKDMKFPIDIIWLDRNGKVVHIEKNLQPCVSVLICTNYSPNTDSQYVLETVSEFTQRHNISVGTDIDFELIG